MQNYIVSYDTNDTHTLYLEIIEKMNLVLIANISDILRVDISLVMNKDSDFMNYNHLNNQKARIGVLK